VAKLVGWASTQRVSADGSVESEQRVALDVPVVERTEEGAARLASRYWAELRRFGYGVLSVLEHDGGVEIRLLPRGPRLLVLGPAETTVTPAATSVSHSILGGVLVRRRGGRISFEQAEGEPAELRSRITGFYPRRGPFYRLVQRKLHVAVSRRYFRRQAGSRPP
jgi:hypothetical protein